MSVVLCRAADLLVRGLRWKANRFPVGSAAHAHLANRIKQIEQGAREVRADIAAQKRGNDL